MRIVWVLLIRRGGPPCIFKGCRFVPYLGGGFIFFIFTPIWERFPFWLIFFQRGWNHQLVRHFRKHSPPQMVPFCHRSKDWWLNQGFGLAAWLTLRHLLLLLRLPNGEMHNIDVWQTYVFFLNNIYTYTYYIIWFIYIDICTCVYTFYLSKWHMCIWVYILHTCIYLPIKITSPTNLQKLGPLFILKFGIVLLCSVVPQSVFGIIARRGSVVLLK